MAEGILEFSVASVVDNVLQRSSKRLSDCDLASRKAEEASLRRYEAAGWLRKTVGVVGSKDLPAEPSEEEFRLALRSGIILCNALNKVQPGAVPKVVEAPSDSVIIPDGAALSAYQYFENVRNFLVVVKEMGLPTFEASDLEQGGKTSRIVICALALKSYCDWKQNGGNGLWKFGGNVKFTTSRRQIVWKNSEPFMTSLRSLSSQRSLDSLSTDQSLGGKHNDDLNDMGNSRFLHTLVHELLSDKKQEEIPLIVENILGKFIEEFEQRLGHQLEDAKTTKPDVNESGPDASLLKSCSGEIEMEDAVMGRSNEEDTHDEGLRTVSLKQQILVEQQHKYIQELKHTLQSARTYFQFLQMKYEEDVSTLGSHLCGLAYSASGYQRVLEENRKLYNQVQDLKGNIRVYCRVRPFLPGQPSGVNTVGHIDEGNITILTPIKYVKDGRKSFTFNRVFGPLATQEDVFSDMQPLIRSVLDGYNVCIFAYGQTGSGKTYTMTGPNELTTESMGVNYRALSDLFLISEQRKDTIFYEVFVQMIEIYNEQVRDLLVSDGQNKRLEIRNSGQKGINVPDANLVPVFSTADVINLMNIGQKNRAVGSTALNDRSSRSHSCLMVHVQGRELATGTMLRSCMHLVDLAGSERVNKSEVVGDRLKEAQHINKSLSALGDVISSLAQKNSHVPYRNSKLTQLLQDSLGGQAKTLMFVHISPEPDAVGETISTLKFAERVSTVELGAARVNKDSADVKELKEQIASLKADLAKKEGEPRQLQHSVINSPEVYRMKSFGSSPSCSISGNHRQAVDDASILEGRDYSASELRRRSLDSQGFSMNSLSSTPFGSPNLLVDERDPDSGNWVDNAMDNKKVGINNDEMLLSRWEEGNRQLPETLYQKNAPAPWNKKDIQDNDVNRNRYEMAITYDSDDLDTVTSDSSETDLLMQINLPKASNIPNGPRSKIRRPSPKQLKGSEVRSLIPSPPIRRTASGNSPLRKPGRQPVPVDAKRKLVSGK